MTFYAEGTADQIEYVANTFVRENVAHDYEVVMTL